MTQVVVSLFDYTGHAVRPWAEAGYTCYCYDNQHRLNEPRVEYVGSGCIVYAHADLSHNSAWWTSLLQTHMLMDVVFVFGFPPCDDLAVSGARHFEAKRLANPAFQEEAKGMATGVETFAELIGAPYVIENPGSVLSTIWRKPDYTFNPCDYGGHLPQDDQHPRWPEYIAPRDAYTKTTNLWTGNGFVMAAPRPVEPEILERVTASGRTLRGSRYGDHGSL